MNKYRTSIYALLFLLVFVVYLTGSNATMVYLHLSVDSSQNEDIGLMNSCDVGTGTSEEDEQDLSTSSSDSAPPRANSVWSNCNSLYSLMNDSESLINIHGHKEIHSAITTPQLSSQLFVFLEPDPPRWA